jgi:putative ABC transport system permease protein
VLSSAQFSIINHFYPTRQFHNMFELNFKIALRNIWKNRTSSLINISGLAIGLAACLLLLLYVSYEWSFDKQGSHADEIYQVLTNHLDANGEIEGTGRSTGNMIGPVLKQDYPEVEAMTILTKGWDELIANGQSSFKKQSRYAFKDILQMFDYTFIYGDKRTALDAPGNVIVTESTAKLLFGTTDVLNKTVRHENRTDLRITGVIKDLPKNSSVGFDFLMPWSYYVQHDSYAQHQGWSNNNWITMVKLSKTANLDQLNIKVGQLIKKNDPEYKAASFLFPLSRLHLYGKFTKGQSTGGNIEQVRLFMGLALGILLIACINFMNMATAKSEKRAKEVGIKKTIGATRTSLVTQFLMESLVLTICSTILAIALLELCMPMFNQLLGIEMGVAYANPLLWIGLLTVVLLTGLIAGSYPAFYLSSFNPIQVLKKKKTGRGLQSVSLRQVLVVGQFTFAVILIIATTVIYKQIQFIKDRPVGYAINELVEVQAEGELLNKFGVVKDQLLKSGAVTAVNLSSSTMSDVGSNFWGMEWPGSTEKDKLVVFNQLATTYDFTKTMGVKLTEGRDFSEKFASDTAAVLLARSAVKRMNLQHPVGQIVKYQGSPRTVIGVFDDFVWGSPFSTDDPTIVLFNKDWTTTITMRLNTVNSASSNIAAIEKVVKSVNPAYPAKVSFVDQLYAEKLSTQRTLGILSNLFGGLAIFISCIGLFGLAAYSAEQRTKEIGVRKVLGASVTNLVRLLSFSFLKMVLIAIVIAIPMATYIMNNWLKNFEFHTSVSWMVITAAALGTISIAIITVSYKSYKSSRTNPVTALKYE